MPDAMTPDALRAARESLGLTGAQMAALLGMSGHARVYEYENGTRNPSGAALRLYRAYLDGYRPPDWPLTPKSAKASPTPKNRKR